MASQLQPQEPSADGPSFTSYHTAYQGVETDSGGAFKNFIRRPDESHIDNGYWRFSSIEDEQRAYAYGFHTPEDILCAVDCSDGEYEDIILRWIPGKVDKNMKMPVTGCAAQHLKEIFELRQFLGRALSRRGVIPHYPISPRLEDYWDARRSAVMSQAQEPGISTAIEPVSHPTQSVSVPSPDLPPRTTLDQDPLNFPSLQVRQTSTSSVASQIPRAIPVESSTPKPPIRSSFASLVQPSAVSQIARNDSQSDTSTGAPKTDHRKAVQAAKAQKSKDEHSIQPSFSSPKTLQAQNPIQVQEQRPSGPPLRFDHLPKNPLSPKHITSFAQQESLFEGSGSTSSPKHVPIIGGSATQDVSSLYAALSFRPRSLEESANTHETRHSVSVESHQTSNSSGGRKTETNQGTPILQPSENIDRLIDNPNDNKENKISNKEPESGGQNIDSAPECSKEFQLSLNGVDMYPGLPCMDCGEETGHKSDCHIAIAFASLKPTEKLTVIDYRRLGEAVERFDPGPWTDHCGPPPEPTPEDAKLEIQGMAEIIRNEESYKNDVSLHALPDQIMIIFWALKTSPNIQVLQE
ncbi:hypothetical protein GQ44DRAFT_766285 [Phaeosphaeriaceae sp. PMI808]|nr:hypothetical protein GQ44DRAFT_766285 [Phaeosphaeriaceae sp. PMI808]